MPIPVVGLEPLEMLPELAIEGSAVPGASAKQKIFLVTTWPANVEPPVETCDCGSGFF